MGSQTCGSLSQEEENTLKALSGVLVARSRGHKGDLDEGG